EFFSRYLRQVVSALRFVHFHGFVHANVKPENILVNLVEEKAMLADFSMCR
ncbi:unnamed protein product, partial [Sphacelaria rigidula]